MSSRKLVYALDTETTGLDFWHNTKPFFVSFCRDDGEQTYFEWRVNPLTRDVLPIENDILIIQQMIKEADQLILHNAKFDYLALYHLDKRTVKYWDWSKVEDTSIAAHVINSSDFHNLTALVKKYIGPDISKYETRLHDIVKKARMRARAYPKWLIASEDTLHLLPSITKGYHYADYWLPREIALRTDTDEFSIDGQYSEWSTVLCEYANVDTAATLPLWNRQRLIMDKNSLLKLYYERKKIVPILTKMQEDGVSFNIERLNSLLNEYREFTEEAKAVMVNIADIEYKYDLNFPKGAMNDSLSTFILNKMKCKGTKFGEKTGKPSLDKSQIEHFYNSFSEGTHQRLFMKKLIEKRKRDAAITYMESYSRFKTLSKINDKGYILHPSINPIATSTLRCSSSNPNEQNISKREGFNLRYCFGPEQGREWYSLDAKNVELRIPAYEAEEKEMISLFERPDDPPYFGSNHLLVCHILYPDKFDECIREGVSFKDRYKSTLYQWVKNGNFAIQYGAIEASGTADAAYHYPGGQRIIQNRFKGMSKLNNAMIAHAQKYGYVETIPDKSVDPKRGYPLWCSRSIYGQILPTVPLNYHVQGTAMWYTLRGMVRCQEQLDKWYKEDKFSGFMTMQVHDEIIFDFPASSEKPTKEIWKVTDKKNSKNNLWRIKILKELIEKCSKDIGIPIPVGVEYHERDWSTGIVLE